MCDGLFLSGQDGTIITHPSKEYQLGKNVDVKVEDRDVWINTRRSNQNHDDVVLIATIDK